MATYKLYKKTSATAKEEVQIPASSVSGLAKVATSGSYNDLLYTPTIPDVSGKLSKTENTGVNVLGTTKSTTTLGGNQLVAPNGIIFAGTAANAGLVTRGICGVSTPDSNGACSKENLYINYDGNNDFNAGRQVVLNAGAVGNHLGSNMYQYAVPRGDIVKAWVEAQGYVKTTQIPTVNNGTLTIQQNGQTVGTFTANQKDGTTANINALSLDGGTINKSKTVKMDASANSDGANLKWGTVNSKNPYIGYASDQTDGTFVVGSLLGTNYASGLAIGGGSGNLLWKGTKVATTNDIPNIVQSTGTSTSSVMSQNATTNAISGKLDKTTYEVNKTIEFGRDGALYVGKFKVYDTNVTCEVTSTTDVTYSGKLVIATQNYVIKQMTVYGDAANTVAPNFFIKPSTTSDPYIEVYFKPSSWSKNVVHIYGSNIEAEPTNVCTNVPSVPSTATSKPTNALNSKANLDGANEFTDGTNTFRDIDGTTQISGSQVILKAIGVMGSASLSVQTDNNNEVFGVESDSESGVIHLNKTISLNGDMGTAGQVLTSQGASAAPQWKSMPTYSLSGTTLTITLP